MTFNPCCRIPSLINYSLDHNLIFPLSMDPDFYLYHMLYKFNLNGARQSPSFHLIQNSVINKSYFKLMSSFLVSSYEEDVLVSNNISSSHFVIESLDIHSSTCNSCRKIVLKGPFDTPYNLFFQKLRNSLAHGNFNFINGTFAGFDKNPRIRSGSPYTGFFKFNIDDYNNFIDKIESIMVNPNISESYKRLFIITEYIYRNNLNSPFLLFEKRETLRIEQSLIFNEDKNEVIILIDYSFGHLKYIKETDLVSLKEYLLKYLKKHNLTQFETINLLLIEINIKKDDLDKFNQIFKKQRTRIISRQHTIKFLDTYHILN